MAIITEQNCPTLRYLKWEHPLDEHPEFRKWLKQKNSKYQNIPFLHLMSHEDDLFDLSRNIITKDWTWMSKIFREDIWTASVAYGKAFEQASDSIYKHRLELYKQMTGAIYKGTYIQATDGTPLCLLYCVHFDDFNKENINGNDGFQLLWKGVILLISGRELVAAASAVDEDGDYIIGSNAIPALRETFKKQNNSVDAALLFQVLDNLVFRKYADVTVREATSRSQGKKEDAAKNDDIVLVKTTLQEKVNRYDINWYTETVRTAGFARKGYIGIRWKGPRGNQHPEFVPIKATWVKGYTRKAKKPDARFTLSDLEASGDTKKTVK